MSKSHFLFREQANSMFYIFKLLKMAFRTISRLFATRKQFYILKSVIPFVIFIVTVALMLQLKPNKNLIRPVGDFGTLEIEKLPEKEQRRVIAHIRETVLQENTDEFLEEVLKQLNYTEIDLRTRPVDIMVHDMAIATLMKNIDYNLGQNGSKAEVPAAMKSLAEKVIEKDAFNRILSEMIPLNRSVPDTRETECRKLTYDTSNYPSMSVIIIFTNEAFISIIRMLHSLIDRTPAKLLREIILVDDFSDHDDLKGKLERYIITRFPLEKIRLVRLSKRSGLIRARMIGAHLAVGDVLVFLDAHCEVINYWCEPLLQRIQEKRSAVVVPVIDVIDSKTMEYYKGSNGYFFIGGFKWTGHFYWIPIPEYEAKTKKHHYEPTNTPTMAGGLFAIDRKYFWEMGSYDPQMEIWGGENLEMSFRIWQCGGSVETIPCSRVGHIFRPFRPYSFTGNNDRHNIARLATVWTDEYKDLMFKQGGLETEEIGDVTKRLEFRKRKNCKSFHWYLSNIYKQKFRLHLDSLLYGQVKNLGTGYCLDDMGRSENGNFNLEVYPCHAKVYPSQTFYISNNNILRKELICADIDNDHQRVKMISCENLVEGKSTWEYDSQQRIKHQGSQKCLAINSDKGKHEAVLETCGNSQTQKWTFNNL